MSNDKNTTTNGKGEERILEILCDPADASEAATVSVKHRITQLVNSDNRSAWNPDKIKQEQAQGSSEPYERSEDVNNLDFKDMLKDLQAHKAEMIHEEMFHCVSENEIPIRCKKRGAAKEKTSARGSNLAESFPGD
jgi:hypothetical protein